jgi:hypothetical protein
MDTLYSKYSGGASDLPDSERFFTCFEIAVAAAHSIESSNVRSELHDEEETKVGHIKAAKFGSRARGGAIAVSTKSAK